MAVQHNLPMNRITDSRSLEERVKKLTFLYSFLMAFPVILIVQNVSIFVFPFLLFGFYKLSGRFFTLRNVIQYLALAFGVAAIISVFNQPEKMPPNSFARALEVLPNYLYWVVLIFLFTSYKEWIRLDAVYRGIFWGVFFSIFYYFFFQDFLTASPLFKRLTQNTFAFLLICYTPVVVWYIWYRFGFWPAFMVLGILSICGFLSGSRSGSLLTLSGGVVTLLLNRRSKLIIVFFALGGYFFTTLIVDSSVVKGTVFNLNQRTYDLIYSRERTLEEDRSYLVRLAQIEKAVLIFDKYPWSGIGLNNFGSYRIKLPGNFEGADYVVNKRNIDTASAHNSYFGFLAEGGLLLVIPFILLLGYNILFFLWNISSLPSEYRPIFIGIIHMSIHLYFIYAILNVFAWFLIALGCMVIAKHKV
jgi:O-antigen ligase